MKGKENVISSCVIARNSRPMSSDGKDLLRPTGTVRRPHEPKANTRESLPAENTKNSESEEKKS